MGFYKRKVVSRIDQKTDKWELPISEEDKAELDLDLITELNSESAEVDDDEEPAPRRKTPAFKIAALLTLLAFVALFAGSYLKGEWLPPLNILSQSGMLKQLPQVTDLEKAVVLIDTVEAKGTGFNIDAGGLIVTNAHVVDQAKVIRVTFANGDIFSSSKWLSFPEVDLALIKIAGNNLPKLDLDKAGGGKTGSSVIIIGNPLGFPFVVSEGKISGLVKLDSLTDPVLIVSGYINQGSSGSPVINAQGKVVGIVFAVQDSASDKASGRTTGYAVAVDSLQKRLADAKKVMDQ